MLTQEAAATLTGHQQRDARSAPAISLPSRQANRPLGTYKNQQRAKARRRQQKLGLSESDVTPVEIAEVPAQTGLWSLKPEVC